MYGDPAACWWWVPARSGTVCWRCGEPLQPGERIAYRPSDGEVLCTLCAAYCGASKEARYSISWRLREAQLAELA